MGGKVAGGRQLLERLCVERNQLSGARVGTFGNRLCAKPDMQQVRQQQQLAGIVQLGRSTQPQGEQLRERVDLQFLYASQ